MTNARPTAGTPTYFASVDGESPSPERERIERLRAKLDEKWGAKEEVSGSIEYETNRARQIEIALPYGCEYLGRTAAELAAIDPATLSDRAAPNGFSPRAQWREARLAAASREKASRMRARQSELVTECANLRRLIGSCEQYLSELGAK
jgi:hypothetical protein